MKSTNLIKILNQIHNSQLTQTTFAIAYMEHDDYDINAFHELLPVLTKQYARVMKCTRET